jgi:hypothetical protein
MRKFLWIGTIAAVGLTGQALAQDAISYSYLEADYLSTDFDRDATFGVKVDGDGFGLQGAVAFGPMLHGYVEYTNQDFDFDLSIETVEVGIGGSWSVAENASIFGRAAYASGDVDFFDDDGYALQAGVRALVSPALELEGLIHYTDIGDFGDNTTFRASGRYWFNPSIALTAGVELDSDVKIWMVGARYSFAGK